MQQYEGMERKRINGATEDAMTTQVMRQTVDDLNPHTGPAWFVSLCGARYDGIQERLRGQEGLVVFTDPRSMDTMALPLSEATIGNIWRKIQAKRAERLAVMNGGK